MMSRLFSSNSESTPSFNGFSRLLPSDAILPGHYSLKFHFSSGGKIYSCLLSARDFKK